MSSDPYSGEVTISSGRLKTSDGKTIAYTHHTSGKDRCLVIGHGFYNSKDAVVLKGLAQAFCPEFDVLLFDLRGHGESSGLFCWTSRESLDLKAVLDHLQGQYRKIGMIGFSLGGSVAINVLAREPRVDALVCVSAAARFWGINFHFWELSLAGDFYYTLIDREGGKGKGVRPGPFWLPKENPIDNVGALTMPVLYIHGTKDWVIKPSHSRDLYARTRSPKKLLIIEGGPHAEYLVRDNNQEFLGEVRAWFSEHLA